MTQLLSPTQPAEEPSHLPSTSCVAARSLRRWETHGPSAWREPAAVRAPPVLGEEGHLPLQLQLSSRKPLARRKWEPDCMAKSIAPRRPALAFCVQQSSSEAQGELGEPGGQGRSGFPRGVGRALLLSSPILHNCTLSITAIKRK